MLKIIRRFNEYQGYNALGSQHYVKAAKYFRKIAAAFATERGVNYNLAISLIGMRAYTEAIDCLLLELKVSGELYNVLLALGEVCFIQGERDNARSYLTAALNKATQSDDTSRLQQMLKNLAEVETYQRIMHGRQLFEQGVSEMDAGNFDEARSLYYQSLCYDEQNALIYNNLGVIALNQDRDSQEAAQYFNKALEYEELPLFRMNLRKASKDL